MCDHVLINTVADTGEMLSILLIRSMAKKFLRKPFWQIWNKKARLQRLVTEILEQFCFVLLYLPGRCIILKLRVANDRRGSAALSLGCRWHVYLHCIAISSQMFLNLSILLKHSSSQCGKRGSFFSLAFSLDAELQYAPLPFPKCQTVS